MQFTDKQLQSFIDLYKKEFGEELSKDEALIHAIKLVNLVKLIYQPISGESKKD